MLPPASALCSEGQCDDLEATNIHTVIEFRKTSIAAKYRILVVPINLMLILNKAHCFLEEMSSSKALNHQV